VFLGEFEHSVDDKNRLTLPARFREALAAGLVVTRGIDPCVNVYTRKDWNRLTAERLGALDPLSSDGRKMQRYFFSGASETKPDRQGRIMLPTPLLEYAKLGREVTIAGVNDHLEIWDRAAWREQMADVEGGVEDVAERVAARRD
jgi:transcriptional regulator MraZ